MGDEERLRRAWREKELPGRVVGGARRRSIAESTETGVCIKFSTLSRSRWTEEGDYGPEVKRTGWPSNQEGWMEEYQEQWDEISSEGPESAEINKGRMDRKARDQEGGR
jgi:hypothetical protein